MEDIEKSITTGLIAFDGAVNFLNNMGVTHKEMLDFLKENNFSIADLSLISEYVHRGEKEEIKEVALENMLSNARIALAIIKMAESLE